LHRSHPGIVAANGGCAINLYGPAIFVGRLKMKGIVEAIDLYSHVKSRVGCFSGPANNEGILLM